jgi:hypothetical protein
MATLRLRHSIYACIRAIATLAFLIYLKGCDTATIKAARVDARKEAAVALNA